MLEFLQIFTREVCSRRRRERRFSTTHISAHLSRNQSSAVRVVLIRKVIRPNSVGSGLLVGLDYGEVSRSDVALKAQNG